LPAALARVQHVSCSSARAGPLNTAREQAMTENNRNGFMGSRPGAAKPQPGRCARSGLLLLFFLGIALLADLAFLLGFHAALVFAFLASGFGLLTASFRANRRHATKEDQGADDGTDGLHVVTFLASRLGPAFSFVLLTRMNRQSDSALTSCESITGGL